MIARVNWLLAAGLISIGLELEPWRAINDSVMGGVSSGQIIAVEDGLLFQGALSLKSRGGFASVRRQIEMDLGTCTYVNLKLKGDRRRYQFRIRQNSG